MDTIIYQTESLPLLFPPDLLTRKDLLQTDYIQHISHDHDIEKEQGKIINLEVEVEKSSFGSLVSIRINLSD